MEDMITICPKCKGRNLYVEDESFDHAFGVEVIKFQACKDCDWVEED